MVEWYWDISPFALVSPWLWCRTLGPCMPSPTTTFGDLRNAKAGQARRRRIPSVAPPPELQDWLRTFQVGTDPGQRVCLRGHWGAVGLKGGCEGAKACLMSLSSDTSYRQAFRVLQWSFSKFFPLAQAVQNWSISCSHWAVCLFSKVTLLCPPSCSTTVQSYMTRGAPSPIFVLLSVLGPWPAPETMLSSSPDAPMVVGITAGAGLHGGTAQLQGSL